MIQLIKKLFSYKFVRFLFAGGLNTLFSYACFAFFMFVTQNKELATTLNLIVAVFFNYLTSSKIVFRENKMSPIVIVKFYGVYAITYVLNLLHLHVTVDIWGWNVYLSQLVTLLYMPLISFTLQRLLVFRKKKTDEAEKPAESLEETSDNDNVGGKI